MRLIKNSLCPHLLSLSSLTSTSLLHMVAWSWACCVSSSSWSHRRAFWCSAISCAPWSPARSFSIASTYVRGVCMCVWHMCVVWCVHVCNVRGMCALVAQFKDQIPVRGQKNSLSPNLATYGCYCRFASIGNLFNSLENQGTESLNMLPAGIIQNDSHLGFSTLCQAKNCQM